MIQREIATHTEDLPHAYRPATQLRAREGQLPPCEVCTEQLDHPLHGEDARHVAREIAHTTELRRELGS